MKRSSRREAKNGGVKRSLNFIEYTKTHERRSRTGHVSEYRPRENEREREREQEAG